MGRQITIAQRCICNSRKTIFRNISFYFSIVICFFISSDYACSEPKISESDIKEEKVDVGLIGSELEGTYLACAVKDSGLRAKIIDTHPEPGGQLLRGKMCFLDSPHTRSGKRIEQGRVRELLEGFREGKIRNDEEFGLYYYKLLSNIPYEGGVKIHAVHSTDSYIDNGHNSNRHAVKSIDYSTKDGVKRRLTANYWVENSDHGALANLLQTTRTPGVSTDIYKQSKKEYMAATYMLKFKNVNWEKMCNAVHSLSTQQKKEQLGHISISKSFLVGADKLSKLYKAKSNKAFLRGLNAVNQGDGEVTINALLIYDVNPANPASIAEAIAIGQQEAALVLKLFQQKLPGWENAELGDDQPDYVYVREYEHFETEYTLQKSDLLNSRMFYDNVSIGSYPLDIQGISNVRWGIRLGVPDKYGMPLRSFLLKGYENVIVAGKNVGASAAAYGSARIQANTATAAESIGIIIGHIHGKKTLRELQKEDWPALHHLLAKKYNIKLVNFEGRRKIVSLNVIAAYLIGLLMIAYLIYLFMTYRNRYKQL